MPAVQVAHIIVVAFALIMTTLFFLVYATRPWYRSSVGRSVMTFSFTLAALCWVGLILRLTDPPWEHWLLIGFYALVGLAVLYQNVVLISTIHKQNKSEQKHKASS